MAVALILAMCLARGSDADGTLPDIGSFVSVFVHRAAQSRCDDAVFSAASPPHISLCTVSEDHRRSIYHVLQHSPHIFLLRQHLHNSKHSRKVCGSSARLRQLAVL